MRTSRDPLRVSWLEGVALYYRGCLYTLGTFRTACSVCFTVDGLNSRVSARQGVPLYFASDRANIHACMLIGTCNCDYSISQLSEHFFLFPTSSNNWGRATYGNYNKTAVSVEIFVGGTNCHGQVITPAKIKTHESLCTRRISNSK